VILCSIFEGEYNLCKQNNFSFIPGSASCQCISSFGGARIPAGKYGQIDLCILIL
jgi:hypothetical protein